MGDLLDELTGELLWLEDEARAGLGVAGRAPGARGALARSRAISWLVEEGRLEVVLAVEAVAEPLVVAALGWESKLRRALGETPGWSPARCVCGARHLAWDAKVGFFVCGECGRHVSEVEERGLVVEEAG
ncbi:hypothetical protein ACIBH1_45300 [Nonomuraea sp. NPDC050663]|uniref:hypothetical protein n=1 Tax=Nonomuraea sp. NPDC050663 TaxID=3364370 RepID=UPI00379043B5